jgi:hypothetical protein
MTTASGARTRYGTRDLVATFGNGRICTSSSCETRLSRYNDDTVCAVHADSDQPH